VEKKKIQLLSTSSFWAMLAICLQKEYSNKVYSHDKFSSYEFDQTDGWHKMKKWGMHNKKNREHTNLHDVDPDSPTTRENRLACPIRTYHCFVFHHSTHAHQIFSTTKL
jgi:hypothetical protein